VGSMTTVFHGDVAPRWVRRITQLPLPQGADPHLLRGAEVGRFNMGSTVILLFGPEAIEFQSGLAPGQRINMGADLGRLTAGKLPN
jgi:phosphatidylserine decarboxylase